MTPDPYTWHDPWEMVAHGASMLKESYHRLDEARYLDEQVYRLLRNQAEQHYLQTRSTELEKEAMQRAIMQITEAMTPHPIFVVKP